MTVRETEVVVVGAGPVGLMLAGELRLGGAEVLVLERLSVPTIESRASTLHARSMEILDSRGLLAELGRPPSEPRGHFAGLPLDLSLPGPYPGQWKVPQARIEEILARWVVRLGGEIRRGCEVRELGIAGDRVEVSGGALRARARYLVGCDGEDSTVRRLIGADFPGRDARRELLRADVAGIDVPDRRFERLDRGFAIAARRADGVSRVMVHEFGSRPRFGGRPPDFATIAETWKRVTGDDISAGVPLWVNAFGDASRQLSSYRHGRVLFAGDAAHQQMPIGGQALNLGLQDAVNLGWKLATRLRDDTAEDLLDSYHTERHPVGRLVLANIGAQASLQFGGPGVDPLRDLLAELIGIDAIRRRLAAMISGLDIRYPAGPGEHPLLGARLPQLPVSTERGPTTTTSLLRGGRGLLLRLTGEATSSAGSPRDLVAGTTGWADRMDVVTAECPDESVAGRTFLVRPDGYVAWISGQQR